ncbi:hypothetical protein ABPG73_013839 [Tetrahymena malaccensis]
MNKIFRVNKCQTRQSFEALSVLQYMRIVQFLQIHCLRFVFKHHSNYSLHLKILALVFKQALLLILERDYKRSLFCDIPHLKLLTKKDAQYDDEEEDFDEEAARKPKSKKNLKKNSSIIKSGNGRGRKSKAKQKKSEDSMQEEEESIQGGEEDNNQAENEIEEEIEGNEQDDQAQEQGEYAEDDFEDEPPSDDFEYDSEEKANKVQRDEVYNLSETDANESWCFICRDQGKLICCENCSKTFHLTCVGIKKPPTGAWECPYCREENKDICCACEKSANEAEIKVTCSLCYRLMHFECLGIPLKQLVDCPMNRNYFLDADTLAILQSISDKDEAEVANEKLKNLTEAIKKLHTEGKQILYSCFTCIGYFGIDKIQDQVSTEVGNCFITKLNNAAYIHSYWLPESVVERKIPRKLKNFKDKKKQVKVALDEEEMEMVLTEEPVDVLEENIKIERIIDCKRPIKHAKRSYRDIYDSIFSKYGDLYEKQIVFGAKTNYKFLIKWQGLFYDECTFEDEYIVLKYKEVLRKYLQVKIFEETIGTPRFQEERENKRKINTQVQKKYKHQPNFITGGSLHKFQIDGVNWLSESYNKANNVILADEMGLGKTVQTVSFLNYLYYEKDIDGPFMVVAPASTLYNWLREFTIWGDKFNVLVYTGNQASRSLIRHREFYFKIKNPLKKGKKKKDLVPKFNALITSYDTAINDAHFLRKIQWECLVVDEAHRLKNNESKFFKISSTIQTRHKVLLTGTPLQNNILELLNLIEFICPQKAKTMKNFESLKMFLQATTAQTKQQQQQDEQIPEAERKKALSELTKMLAPHLLRRKKTDVDLELPEMEEIIVKISLTDTQKYYYKNVLVKNYDNLKLLDNKSKNFSKFSLLNILMSLRLVCNHPSLFLYKKKYVIPKKDKFQEEFVDCSNKLKFLERMIPKLLQQNHKMLIFSQFTMMLDILGEFFNFKGWAFERLDGTTSVIDRQKTIDAFNQKDSKAKIFLLSTRAGGLGINLTSADTIFFTDSDFNPYRDVQAISRAYRMGQESKVKVYRLVSKYSAEERIIEIATRKLLLESIIINPINKFTKEDFETILKNGTYEMFNKNLEEKDQEFTDEQIDALISREGDMIKGNDVENVSLRKSDLNDYYLSGFKFNSYNFETVDERQKRNDEEEKQKDQKKYWETLLDDQAKQLQSQQASELGKGKRVRKMINSTLQDDHNRTSDSYSEFDGEGEKDKTVSESDGGADEVVENFAKKQNSKNTNAGASNANNYFQEDQQNKGLVHKNKKTTDKILKYFDEEIYSKSHMKFANMTDIDRFQFVLNGFNEFHRMEFLSFILEFGMDFNTIDQFWLELQKNRPETFKKDHKPTYMDFKKYLKEFYAALLFYKRLEKLDNAVFCGLSPELVVRRIGGLSILRKKYNYFTKKPEKFRVSHKEYSFHQAKLDENNKIEFQKLKWTNYDDYLLIHAIFAVGFGNWEKLLENKILWDYPQDLNLQIWQIIFHKFDEKEDRDINTIDSELGQKYVIRKLQNRANNMMNFLLDVDEGKKEE